MFLHIQDVLTADEVAFFRQKLWAADAPWVDGARSAGGQAVHQKNNLQLAQASELSAQLQGLVKAALNRNALFFSAALPRRIYNPLFNKYGDGANFYGNTWTAPSCTPAPTTAGCAATFRARCSSPRPRTMRAASW